MENEKLILTILQELQSDFKILKTDVAELKTDVAVLKTDVAQLKTDVADLKMGQEEIKKDIAAIKAQTADLTEFKTETIVKFDTLNREIKDTKQNVYDIEQITGKNLTAIAKLKSII